MVHILKTPYEAAMQIPLSEAKARLTDLARRAEAGEDVILTRHGQPAVRLVAVNPVPTATARRALITRLQDNALRVATAGPSAAESADFLYDDKGMPL